MITKSIWQAVVDEMTAADRERLGEPPSFEQASALTRGELSEEQAERVRESLLCYPELARIISEPFPEDDVAPGDPGYLSEHEIARRFASLQSQVHPPSARGVQFWPVAIAAAMALVFSGLWFQFWQTRVVKELLLNPDGERGIHSPATVAVHDESVSLTLAAYDDALFKDYRVEIRDADPEPPRPLWTEHIERSPDRAFRVQVPRELVRTGNFQVAVFGIDRGQEHLLTTYTYRIAVH
ncbi:MAG TPA: hypothetical protein VMU84_09835 [Thermoanaerobaculia bacterium]|nr:hypothetical protein [Thermoanaerobaculia bacterium]